MITLGLLVVALGCLGWFVYEVRTAWMFARQGVRCDALVSGRQWVVNGKTRNLQISVKFATEAGPIERPIGFRSWFGFGEVQVGVSLRVIFHPKFPFVLPEGVGGLLSRPIIAGSLLLVSGMLAAAFWLVRGFP